MARLSAPLLLMLAVLASPALAEAPFLHVDMPYMRARHLLLLRHWMPTNAAHDDMPDQEGDDFQRQDFVRRGAGEVGACFGTGMSQCFAVWRKGARVLVVESRNEGYDARTGSTVYLFYEVPASAALTRETWDLRSVAAIPGSYPKSRPW